MAYGLYNVGKGGSIRKIKGNPRGTRAQKRLIVWDRTRGSVVDWIKEFGTKTQKEKHMKSSTRTRPKKKRATGFKLPFSDLW